MDWNIPLIHENQRYSKTDLSFSLGEATAIAVGSVPVIGAATLGLYCLIWGIDSLLAATSYFRQLQILLPIILISIAAHEGLHWTGYVGFARLSRKKVRIGFNLGSLAAYVHSDYPVSIAAYRGLVALPGVVLGVIPAVVGIGWEAGWITLYGFLMLIGASGDLAILWRIHRVARNSLVVDHPYRAGCWVLANREEDF